MKEHDLYTQIIRTTDALIVVLDSEGRIVQFNPSCERLTGYRFDEVKGRRIWDFLLLPEETAAVRAVFENLRQGRFQNQFANFWVAKSGERRFIEWSNSAVPGNWGEVELVIGTGIDVTEKRAAMAALTASEARLRALLENALDLTAIVGADGRIRFITPSATRALGYAHEELIGSVCFELCHPDDLAATEAAFHEAIAHPGTVTEVTRRLRHKDGHWVSFESFWISLLSDPHIQGVVVTSRDVTERVRAQRELSQIQQRLRALLDGLPDAVWLKDAEGRYIEVNRSFRERSGVGSAEIAGRTDDEIFPAELVDAFSAMDREVLASGLPVRKERKVLLQGKERWVDVSKVAITDGAGKITGLVGIGRDVSKRKLAEAQRLVRDASLRAALVREVHHRIKNSLQGIITLLQRAGDADSTGGDPLELAISRINAIAAMHGLHGATNEGDLELEKIVMTLVSSLRTLDPALPLRLSVRGGPVSAWVKESEIVPLALVLSELVMNAVKHSRGAGNDTVEVVLEIGADAVRIAVRNGSGRLPQSFDFDAGEGLGVGLSLVKSLLPPEGAMLRLANRAGGGVHGELTLRPPVIASSPRAKSLIAGQHADPLAASSP